MDQLLRFVGSSGGCLVSTSRQESFGMAAAEAMASSCPVVVPDVGGFRDFVVNDSTGFRYPPGDSQAAVELCLKTNTRHSPANKNRNSRLSTRPRRIFRSKSRIKTYRYTANTEHAPYADIIYKLIIR